MRRAVLCLVPVLLVVALSVLVSDEGAEVLVTRATLREGEVIWVELDPR
ncbi:MAG: hypothetical protein KF878_11455 [Planctomycetes bacterium]|nr:hypothetical protein [Planctomycetota bacterium]